MDEVINLNTIIGVYPLCNTGAVLVHDIDYSKDKVLASINGKDPEWCKFDDKYIEEEDDWEFGFYLGEWFIPFSEVMRFYS